MNATWPARASTVDIPMEIAQMIVEEAAGGYSQIDQQQACTLALVSKALNGWITPKLYATVVLHSPARIAAFHASLQNSALVSYVRNIFISPPLPDGLTYRVFFSRLQGSASALVQIGIDRCDDNSMASWLVAPRLSISHAASMLHGYLHPQIRARNNLQPFASVTHLYMHDRSAGVIMLWFQVGNVLSETFPALEAMRLYADVVLHSEGANQNLLRVAQTVLRVPGLKNFRLCLPPATEVPQRVRDLKDTRLRIIVGAEMFREVWEGDVRGGTSMW